VPDKPETLEELRNYILKYKDDIYLREQVNGKWDAYALSSLPADKAIEHVLEFVLRFVKVGFIPYRVK